MNRLTLKRGATLSVGAPANATRLRLGGAGKLLIVDVADGRAVVTAETSRTLPIGDYATEWEIGADEVALPAGPRIRVAESLLADEVRMVAQTHNERVLDAARTALETAAQSADLSFSIDGSSFSFESRNDLLAFVRRIELRVARDRNLPRQTMPVRL